MGGLVSSTWTWLVVACAVMAFVIKATGPVAFGGRPLPRRLRGALFLVAAPLLAALVVTQALADGNTLQVDAVTAGVASAGLAGWVRVPGNLCLVAAAAVTAGIRAAGG
jgi:branched-subunit amino acid transport protein